MRIILISLFSLFLFSCNDSQGNKEDQPIASKHSSAFNTSVQSALDSYHSLTEAFVNWDSAAVLLQAKQLQVKLDSIKLDEFPNEAKGTASGSVDLAKRDLQNMTVNNSLTDKRHALNSLTQNLYDFLKTVQYDEKKIYLNECPMAFNDTDPGDWLSETDSIRNPYLGLHHPKYGKAMIDCGSNKSTIDFTKGK